MTNQGVGCACVLHLIKKASCPSDKGSPHVPRNLACSRLGGATAASRLLAVDRDATSNEMMDARTMARERATGEGDV